MTDGGYHGREGGTPRRQRFIEGAALIGRVVRDQSEERLGLAAAGAAFWLVIAVFPATLAAVSIFGLLTSPDQVARELASVADAGPDSLGSFIARQLHHIAETSSARLSLSLVVSIVAALWSTSAGVYNMVRAVRAAYGLPSVRYVNARLRALVGAVIVVVGLGVVALWSALLTDLFDRAAKGLEALIGVPVLVVLLTALVGGLYRFALWRPQGIRSLLPGALGSAVTIVVLVVGFDAYLHYSTHLTAVYGALAGVVLAMLFAYLAIYAMLLGAQLNAQVNAEGEAT